jgi:hypothetical protein
MGRRSKAQGEGARDSGRRNPGYVMDIDKPCQGDAETLRRPLRARILSVPTPRVSVASRPPPWAFLQRPMRCLRSVPDLSLWLMSGCTPRLGLA